MRADGIARTKRICLLVRTERKIVLLLAVTLVRIHTTPRGRDTRVSTSIVAGTSGQLDPPDTFVFDVGCGVEQVHLGALAARCVYLMPIPGGR